MNYSNAYFYRGLNRWICNFPYLEMTQGDFIHEEFTNNGKL